MFRSPSAAPSTRGTTPLSDQTRAKVSATEWVPSISDHSRSCSCMASMSASDERGHLGGPASRRTTTTRTSAPDGGRPVGPGRGGASAGGRRPVTPARCRPGPPRPGSPARPGRPGCRRPRRACRPARRCPAAAPAGGASRSPSGRSALVEEPGHFGHQVGVDGRRGRRGDDQMVVVLVPDDALADGQSHREGGQGPAVPTLQVAAPVDLGLVHRHERDVGAAEGGPVEQDVQRRQHRSRRSASW